MTLTRRKLFAMTAGAGFYARFGAADVKTQGLIINSARPKDHEMSLGAFHDWITPAEHFFIRSHHYTPDVKLADWNLRIEGVVNKPITLSLDDLKKMPRVKMTAVLECAGNGRAFYEPRVPGMQWRYGAVGNGRWTGVRLRDVLLRAGGVKDSAKEILFNAADVPIGKMPKFQRTVPVAKALDPDTLLSYELNDQPLPMDHGFPLRLIASGWAGDSWVKWIQRTTGCRPETPSRVPHGLTVPRLPAWTFLWMVGKPGTRRSLDGIMTSMRGGSLNSPGMR